VLLGLDNSGKTTMLYLLTRQRQVKSIPTVGINDE